MCLLLMWVRVDSHWFFIIAVNSPSQLVLKSHWSFLMHWPTSTKHPIFPWNIVFRISIQRWDLTILTNVTVTLPARWIWGAITENHMSRNAWVICNGKNLLLVQLLMIGTPPELVFPPSTFVCTFALLFFISN